MISLRRAVDADLEEIGELERRIFPDPWSSAALEEAIVEGEALVAVDEQGRVVGYVTMACTLDLLHVQNLAVRRGQRRQGVGRRLLQASLDLGRERGAQAAILEVRASNRPARSLYTAAGFQIVGRRRAYYRVPAGGLPEDAVVYRCPLSSPESDE